MSEQAFSVLYLIGAIALAVVACGWLVSATSEEMDRPGYPVVVGLACISVVQLLGAMIIALDTWVV